MADYLIDARFQDARNALAVCLGLALGMAVVAPALLRTAEPARWVAAPGGAGSSLEVDLPRAVASTAVTIRNPGGKIVLATITAQHQLFAALPADTYFVQVANADIAGVRTVAVRSAGLARVAF